MVIFFQATEISRSLSLFLASVLSRKTGEKHEILYHCHCKQFECSLWKCISMRGQTVMPCSVSRNTSVQHASTNRGIIFLCIQSLRESTVLFVFSGVVARKRKLLQVICVHKTQNTVQNNVLHLCASGPSPKPHSII